jgi:hypothetical protein
MKHPLSTESRGIRKIFGYITNNGTAAIAGGDGFSIVRNGAGDVSVTLKKPGKSILGCQVLCIETTASKGHSAKLIAAPAATGVRIGTYVADATDGAPADVDFFFEIAVKDSP